MYVNVCNNLLERHESIQDETVASSWTLASIDSFRININRYDPLRAASYIELPKILASKKAIINVTNVGSRATRRGQLGAGD